MTRIPIDDDQEPQADQTLEGEPNARAGAGGGTDANEFERLKSERDMLFEKLARAQADFQNSRKRLQAEADALAERERAVEAKAEVIELDQAVETTKQRRRARA